VIIDRDRGIPHDLISSRQPAIDAYPDRGYGNGELTTSIIRDEDAEDGQHRPRTAHSVRRISQLINPPLQPPTRTNGLDHSRPVLPPMSAPPLIQHFNGNRTQSTCRFKCLESVIPLINDVIEADLACDLLEFYFAEPDSALFRHASPYVLSPVIRKYSLLHPTNPRPTTAALLVTMIWTSAQTADIPFLSLPGRRGQICEKLRVLVMALAHDRDRDHWHRALGEKPKAVIKTDTC
jgi:hypothetical protein